MMFMDNTETLTTLLNITQAGFVFNRVFLCLILALKNLLNLLDFAN
jgi:hypothetical protein